MTGRDIIRNSCLLSMHDAEEYIQKGLSAIGIEDTHVTLGEGSFQDKIGPLSYSIVAGYNNSKTRIFKLGMSVMPSGKLLVGPLDINSDHRGRGVSDIALKVILAMAYEMSLSTIMLDEVRGDGISFWPRQMAAAPEGFGVSSFRDIDVRDAIKAEVENIRVKPGERDADTLSYILERSANEAYYLLAQSDIRLSNGKRLSHEVLRGYCDGENLSVSLRDERTITALNKHIGRIPPFKSPQRTILPKTPECALS